MAWKFIFFALLGIFLITIFFVEVIFSFFLSENIVFFCKNLRTKSYQKKLPVTFVKNLLPQALKSYQFGSKCYHLASLRSALTWTVWGDGVSRNLVFYSANKKNSQGTKIGQIPLFLLFAVRIILCNYKKRTIIFPFSATVLEQHSERHTQVHNIYFNFSLTFIL